MDGDPVVGLLYGKHLLLEGEFLLGDLGQQQVVENWTRENKVVVPKAGERTIAKGCNEKFSLSFRPSTFRFRYDLLLTVP